MKSERLRYLLDIPVTKPAVKSYEIHNTIKLAYHYGDIEPWEWKQLMEQWEYTTPHIRFPFEWRKK